MQREGEVIHFVTDRLEGLVGLLHSVGERDETFPLRHGRGDAVKYPGAPDVPEVATVAIDGQPTIKVRTGDFR